MCSTAYSASAWAEDCTGTLPGANCTIDEDTTAPLTIDNGIVLTTGANISINHTIDGSTAAGDGTVQTNSGGVTVIQNEAIGSNTTIDNLVIGDGDTWTTFAPILTNNDGADIDLGAGDGGETLNFNNGSSFTGVIDGNNGDNVNFGADGLGGTIEANGAIQSVTVNVISGTTNINQPVGNVTPIGGLNIADGATLNTSRSITSSGALDLDGTLSLDSNDAITADTYVTDADGGSFQMGISRNSGTTAIGSVNIQNGGPVDFSNDTVSFNIEAGSETLVNETLTATFIGNGGATTAPVIIDNNFLYDFSFTPSGSNLDLNVSRLSFEQATDSSNNLNSADMILTQMDGQADPNIQAIQNNLLNASSGEQFNALLESTQPPTDGSSAISARLVHERTSRLIHDRMSTFRTKFPSVRSVSSPAPQKRRTITTSSRYQQPAAQPRKFVRLTAIEPAAGGDTYETASNTYSTPSVVPNRTRELAERRRRYLEARNRNTESNAYNYEEVQYYKDEGGDTGVQIWTQAFTTTAEQGARDGLSSYDVDGSGITFGVDTGDIHEKLTLGAALTYADTDINSSDLNNTNSEVQTYQASIYSAYHFDSDYYFNGIFSYAMSDISGRRSNIGGTSLVGDSQYDAEQIALSGAFGKNIMVDDDLLVQPSIQADYTFMEFEQYREDGADGAGLSVRQSSLNALTIGPYLKVVSKQDFGDEVKVMPEGGIGYSYDVIQDEVNAVSSFQALGVDGPPEFATNGFDPQAHNLDLDLAVNFEYHKWSGKLGYNFDYQEDLTGHTGSVNVNYHF